MSNLLRVGNTIINLDNVLAIDLDWQPNDESESQVVFEFSMRGWDELDEGANVAQPYLKIFEGEEAAALRKHVKTMCVDLMANR